MANALYIQQEVNRNQALPYQKIFEAQSGLALLLSPQLVIEGASDAYLRETFTKRENIIGSKLFDVFPENPNALESKATQKLKASLDKVLASGKPDKMAMFQYDIPDPAKKNSFIERYWITTNKPLVNEKGEVICIIHETVNVTEEIKAKLQLQESQQREKAALAQAEQQRLRLERLFEQAPAAMAMLEGPDFIFRVVNESYQQLFPGRKLMNLPLFEALPELRDQPVYEIFKNVYETGETYEGNEVLIPMARYQGQPMEDIYWNFIYQALFNAEGQVSGILIFALDVTDFVNARRQVEENAETLKGLNLELEENMVRRKGELRRALAEADRQSKRLENLFMQAPAAICILEGPDLVFSLVNPDYQLIFPERQLLGKPLLEALPELRNNPSYASLRHVYETGQTHEESEILIPIVRPEHAILEDRYFRYVQQASYDEQGQIDGVVVFALEITEEVEARKAVEASEQQLRLITDALPVLISYLDKNERYCFANKAYDVWFNLNGKNIINKPIKEVIGEKAYDSIKGYIKRVLAGERLDYEATIPYREGTKHTRSSFVPDFRHGEIVGYYALVTDITDQVEARLALEQNEKEAKAMAEELAAANESFRLANAELDVANKQLTHINADLDNFIYTASHDLKAPISNIEMLMDELLLELPQESLELEEVVNIMNMIKGAIVRFKKTIASLTEISKLQKDEEYTQETVSIADVVKDVMLDLEQVKQKSSATIDIDLDGCTTVSFSEKNLRSIIYNLLSNAIKYCHPERDPAISLNCYNDSDFVVLQVQDNGLGLNTDQQTKLFTMFRRFHDHVEGSGVGLYMVKRIVENAGGRIEVESKKGEGSTFRVYLRK